MSGVRHIGPPTRGEYVDRWAVDSDTLGNEYTVGLLRAGVYDCTCPAWKYHREKKQRADPSWTCKHIKSVQDWQAHPRARPAELLRQVDDLQGLLDRFHESVAGHDFEGVVAIREKLTAYRAMLDTCVRTIDEAVEAADRRLLQEIAM